METTTSKGDLDPVDKGVRQFVDALNEGYAAYPDLDSLPIERRREIAEEVRRAWREAGPIMHETRDFEVCGVRLRLHRPTANKGLPVLIYLHGGGWMFFSNDTHDRLMREYAAAAGVAVIGVEYSLSPKAKFPTALNEIDTVIDWLLSYGGGLGLDPFSMAIGGDSAGANLALSTALIRRDEGKRLPDALVLNYGAFDPEHTDSYDLYGGPQFPLNGTEMDMFWANYVADPAQLSDPRVAPLRADLNDLPPVFLAIAECDILTDCNHAVAEKLVAAGVPVMARTYPGTTHSFLEAMSVAEPARQAIAEQAAWIKEQLTDGTELDR